MIFDVTRNASRKDQTAEATRTVTSQNRASLGGSTLATVAVTAVAQPLQRFGLEMGYDTEFLGIETRLREGAMVCIDRSTKPGDFS